MNKEKSVFIFYREFAVTYSTQRNKPDFWDEAKQGRKMTVRKLTLKNWSSMAATRRSRDEQHFQTGALGGAYC
jgi:hypothetical protein